MATRTTKPKTNGPPTDVLTLAEAAAYLRVAEADVLRLAKEKQVPCKLIGTEWRFSRTALQQWLGTPVTAPDMEAALAWGGKFRDDPFLEEIVQEAYRKRGRPITENGE